MDKTIDFNHFAPYLLPYKEHTYKWTFTVFIPAYNAEKTIKTTLQSIEKQTFRDFEVLIVNDGSKDGTTHVVEEYMKDTQLDIRFVDNKENQHKVPVFMEAIQIAEGQFFIVVDADDTLRPDGLEILKHEYDTVPNDLKPLLLGVSSLIEDTEGKLVGDDFPESPFYSNTLDTKFYHKIDGDKEGIVKTDVLRRIKFNDTIKKGGFYPLGMLWLLLANEGYLIKYVNTVTYTYDLGVPNSITKVGYKVKSFGFAVYAVFFINTFHKRHFYRMPKEFFKRLVSLLVASLYLDYSKKSYTSSVKVWGFRVLIVLLWPFRKVLEKLV